MKINLVMIVKNEERFLEQCLRSAGPLVDDMIVADTGSTDRTVEIARNAGAKVFHFQWVNDFSAARNYALNQSDGDWNLVLDGDEILRGGSREELEAVIEGRDKDWVGAIIRYDRYRDEEGISVSASVLPRLLPRGVRYTGTIHEQPDTAFPCFQIPLEADHDGYLYADKGERNLPYLQKAAAENPGDGYYQYQLATTLRNLKRLKESLPFFQAFYKYAQREEGYRSGGVVLYLYTLLDLEAVEYLDEAQQVIDREAPALSGKADFCFVCGLFYMKRVLSDVSRFYSLLPQIESCYQRCLMIGERPEDGGVVGTGSFKASYNLGVWYEVSGQKEKAKECYRSALEAGYEPAGKRLKEL